MILTQTFNLWWKESTNIVFFGGAGVSTASGIPDFRSAHGLYKQPSEISPEVILSASYFREFPDLFYDYYWDHLYSPKALPNAVHNVLASEEKKGRTITIITQNVDGLHQTAGSRDVLELHGNGKTATCFRCSAKVSLADCDHHHAPHCQCGGVFKPDIVLYEEPLDNSVFQRAQNAIAGADLLIVAGTSLSVYPAAGLITHYQGHKMVLINKTKTSMDNLADLVLHEDLTSVFSQLK